MHIFHNSIDGVKAVTAQGRGLPAIEKLVLATFTGTRIDCNRERIVVIERNELSRVVQSKATANAITEERTNRELRRFVTVSLLHGGRTGKEGSDRP
jgi:hypothetical protein